MTPLAWDRYGKARIRLVKVERGSDADAAHDVIDLTIDVQLEGAFGAVFDGDNSACLATDTMKNTVYAMARGRRIEHAETFAIALADHFAAQPAVSKVQITSSEPEWSPIAVGGHGHPHAFIQSNAEQRTSVVTRDGSATTVISGIANLVVLKTTDSAFSGFPRDRFTTLAETEDRILATSITAAWTYRRDATEFAARSRIRTALLETFATHHSRSVQHTLKAMGDAALAVCADALDITLTMPNRHHLLVDLTPFGLDNPNEIFVATDQPYGLIEARIVR